MLVGPRGSTLAALQDLTRAVVQRQCPSRTDRILVDVAGYRERRLAALKRFSIQIAEEVLASGQEKALEAMSPADRKAVHDAINEIHRGCKPAPRARTQTATSSSRRQADAAAVPGPEASQDSPAETRDGCTILGEARRDGFLGPGPLDVHLRHAAGFADVARRLLRLAARNPRSSWPADRRSGVRWRPTGTRRGCAWTEAQVVLLDANARRTAFLRRAVNRLRLDARVSVVQERAERYGRLDDARGTFDGAMARSFGRPAVVAECAAPLLRRGGWFSSSRNLRRRSPDPPPRAPLAGRGPAPVGPGAGTDGLERVSTTGSSDRHRRVRSGSPAGTASQPRDRSSERR